LGISGVTWDEDPNSYKHSITEPSKFSEQYPNSLILRWVSTAALSNNLIDSDAGLNTPLWKHGSSAKLAKAIAFIRLGNRPSPSIVEPVQPQYEQTHGTNRLVLAGGHHRFYVARALEESVLPILIRPHQLDAVSNAINLAESKDNALKGIA